MQTTLKFLFVIVLIFVGFHDLPAQKYVKDSVILRFRLQNNEPIKLFVDTVLDKREELTGSQLRITERTRYLFIPVDHCFVLQEPLQKKIKELFENNKPDTIHYNIIIDEFELNQRGGFFPGTTLSAKLRIYEGLNGQPKKLKGSLIYRTIGPKAKAKELESNYNDLLETWKNDFIKDMYRVKDNHDSIQNFDFYNYRPLKDNFPTYMFLSSIATVGINWWMVDAELGFYDPEASQKFIQESGFIRYRWTKRFESVAFGSRAAHVYYRISPSWMVELFPQYCIGVNQWKDWSTYSHKIYDIMNINGSLSEGITYNPIDLRSLLFSVGLMQDVYFIYSTGWQFKPGLFIKFGIKI